MQTLTELLKRISGLRYKQPLICAAHERLSMAWWMSCRTASAAYFALWMKLSMIIECMATGQEIL